MTAEDLRDRAAAAGARTDKPSTPGSDVAKRGDGAQPSLAALVNQLKPELARALPAHIKVDRVARIAITALRRTPKLNQCTPESFLGALLTASQLGLEVNTPAGEAYLIPYKRECTLVVGYQGIVKLFWQHPQAKHIDAQAVFTRDEFSYAYGLDPHLTHKPATGDRGNVVAYYAVATLQSGGSAFVVLTPEEVKALRQGKEGPSGDIADPQRWMERKTALKQMLKLLPKTVELTAAIAADEQVRTDYTQALDAMEVRAPAELPATLDVVAETTADADIPAEQPTGQAEQATAEKPAADTTERPADAGGQGVAAAADSPADVEDPPDACPACGAIPSHAPSDCPMGDS